MEKHPHVVLKGSYKISPDSPQTGQTDAAELLTISILLRRKKPLEAKLISQIQSIDNKGAQLSHLEFENEYGASSADVQLVEAFATQYNLKVTNVNLASRTIYMEGSVVNMESAFSVKLLKFKDQDGNEFRGRSGNVHVPRNLEQVIEGVYGLDNRKAARPMFQYAKKEQIVINHSANPISYTGDQLAKIYGFPKDVTGKGQTIAIIELGGGYSTKDLQTYFSEIGVPLPVVESVLIGGATNSPTDANGPDAEVMLDIEVSGAVAPGAKILVYFAPNTDQGFLDCVTSAIHDAANNPSVISISWGSPESNYTAQSTDGFNQVFQSAAALGITICVAAGDQGSSDGMTDGKVHVDFPASSPFVLGCGGTKLDAKGKTINSEVVWHESNTSASGGGISEIFALPDYQAQAGVPLSLNTQFKGRGVPDVAGNADPSTGYKVLVDGQQAVIGGTSAVAPLMAGLIALINEKQNNRAGFINPKIYAGSGICRDILVGDNKTTDSGLGYAAGPGWDACTGLGVFSGFN